MYARVEKKRSVSVLSLYAVIKRDGKRSVVRVTDAPDIPQIPALTEGRLRVILMSAWNRPPGNDVAAANQVLADYIRLYETKRLAGEIDGPQLLEARLAKNREQAYDACARRIAELGLPTVLLDVEHLFDGRTLVFYFLGDITSELEAMTVELAELYDAQARFREFAKAVEEGCGPGCGTDQATGRGCSSCATGCAVAGACGTHARGR